MIRIALARWRIEMDQLRRQHAAWRQTQSRGLLGAYGYDVYPGVEPSELNDSLLVAWLAAEDGRSAV